jgi:hypothetical protein
MFYPKNQPQKLISKIALERQMTTTVQINTELWEKFTDIAQQQRKRPNHLIEKLVAEYLSIQGDPYLDEMIRELERSSGYNKSDAVEVVKQYRQKRAT